MDRFMQLPAWCFFSRRSKTSNLSNHDNVTKDQCKNPAHSNAQPARISRQLNQ